MATVSATSAVRRRRVALGVYHAFHVVEDVARETETPIDDKAALALQKLDEWMLANGWRPLKPGEAQAAALQLKSINGQQKAATQLAVAAATAAAGAPAASPPAP